MSFFVGSCACQRNFIKIYTLSKCNYVSNWLWCASVVILKKTTTFQFGHHSAKTAFGESADLNSKVHCPLGSMSLAQLALLLQYSSPP